MAPDVHSSKAVCVSWVPWAENPGYRKNSRQEEVAADPTVPSPDLKEPAWQNVVDLQAAAKLPSGRSSEWPEVKLWLQRSQAKAPRKPRPAGGSQKQNPPILDSSTPMV